MPFLLLHIFHLFHLPDIVGLQQFGEIMILLLTADLLNLSLHTVIIGRSIYITDDTKGNRESVTITHKGKFQL